MGDLHPALVPVAVAHFAHVGDAFLDGVDVGLIAALHQRVLRHHQRLALLGHQPHGEQHAGPQQQPVVVDVGPDRGGAGHRIHPGVHGPHGGVEGPLRVGDAVGRQRQPRMQQAQIGFRQGEVELDDGHVVEGGDRRAGRDQGAGADLPETENTAERRADQPVRQPRQHRLIARLGSVEPGPRFVHLGDRHGALGQQVLEPFELGAGVLDVGLGLRQQGRLLPVGEFDQHVAGLDVAAVVEAHLIDRVGDLGRDGDGLVGPRRADGLDLAADHARLGGLGDHQGGAALAPGRAAGRGVFGAPGRQQHHGGQHEQDSVGHAAASLDGTGIILAPPGWRAAASIPAPACPTPSLVRAQTVNYAP